MKEITDIMDESGFINYWNYSPQGNILVIQTIKMKIKTRTESGIIISTQETKEALAPDCGIVRSQGPDCKEDWIGKVVYYPAQSIYPLEMIRKDEDGTSFVMTTEERIDAILVQDVRD